MGGCRQLEGIGKADQPADLAFRGRALALRQSTRARAAPVAMILRRWSKSGAPAQGVRAGVLMGGSSLWVSCISAHLATGQSTDFSKIFE